MLKRVGSVTEGENIVEVIDALKNFLLLINLKSENETIL